MLTLTRNTKRLTIIVIYIFLFLGLGIGVYALVRPAPTCFDGQQNQNESGIDCGGVCAKACVETVTGQPLVVRSVTALPLGDDLYDVVAEINNPNTLVGASDFQYVIRLTDATGQVVGTEEGRSWILPAEDKTLLALNMRATGMPTKATIELSAVTWTKLTSYLAEPKIGIYHQAYTTTGRPGERGGIATGLIVNESNYDFRTVVIRIILRDAAGQPVGVNQTDRRTFRVGEQHDFRLPWPNPLKGDVVKVDVDVDVDVYQSDAFIRQYAPQRQTQNGAPGARY